MMNWSEISGLLLALGAFATAVYAIIGGRIKAKNDRNLTAAEVEQRLRAALYEGFEKQRLENEKCQGELQRLRKEVVSMEQEVGTLKIEVDIHKKEIEKLKNGNKSRNRRTP